MASIENERDDPEPDLLDHPSPPKTPLLSAATGASNVSLNSDVEARIKPDATAMLLCISSHSESEAQTSPTINSLNNEFSELHDASTRSLLNGSQLDVGYVDRPMLSRRELKRKLAKEMGKQRSHDIRKKSRIDNPTIQDHGKKKYLDSAVPLFTNAQIGKAAVASTGYVGLEGKKKKKVGKGKGGQVEGRAAVLHEDITEEMVASGVVDYSQADAMLKELLNEKRHTLLPWDGL
jgi:hypothetical protein